MVFWFPYTTIVLIAAILMLYVVLKIWWLSGFSGIYKHWRLVAFLFYGISAYLYASINHWVFDRGSRTQLTESLTAWYLCLATHLDQSECYARGHVPGGFNVTAYIADLCVNLSPEIVFAVILLSDPEIALHWYDSFRRFVLRQNVPDRWASQKRALKLSRSIISQDSLPPPSSESASFLS